MEKSLNPSFWGVGGEDEKNWRSMNGSNMEPSNLLGLNQIAAETEPMRQPEPAQRQPADISSADSNPRSIISHHLLARKREANMKYRKRKMERQKGLELEAENGVLKHESESLKGDIVLRNQRFETQSKELDKLKNKYKKQRDRKRQLKSEKKSLEAENGQTKNDLIKSLKKENEVQSELHQLRSKLYKLEKLEKELASKKSCSCRQSIAGNSTNFSRDLGQCPNVEEEGCMQSSPTTVYPPSPATAQPGETREMRKRKAQLSSPF